MALVIQTNTAAIAAQKNININSSKQNTALNRLSSGFRINTAADDAAGFAISSKLDAQGSRLKAASQNASQATALVKTAEAGVNEIQNMVVRLQSLAIQASSANNAGQLTQLDAERTKLTNAIDKIANSTNFNGTNLLNGTDANLSTTAVSSTAQTLSAGTNTGFTAVTGTTGVYENATFAITTTAGAAASEGTVTGGAQALGAGITGINISTTSVKSASANQSYYFSTTGLGGGGGTSTSTLTVYSGTDATGAVLGTAAIDVANAGATTITLGNSAVFDFTIVNAALTVSNATAAVTGSTAATSGTVTSVKSNLDLKDSNGSTIAAAGAELLAATQNRPATATGLTLTLKALTGGTGGTITVTDATTGAAQKTGVSNVSTTLATSGTSVDYAGALAFQVGADNNTNNQVTVNLQNKYTTAGLSITGDVSTASNAKTYIDTLKSSLSTLISQRADLGAASNQLVFVQANLATSIEQVASSVSSIRDADIAAEMASFSKSQILVQAGTAMLAQANQSNQNVLRLFQ